MNALTPVIPAGAKMNHPRPYGGGNFSARLAISPLTRGTFPCFHPASRRERGMQRTGGGVTL